MKKLVLSIYLLFALNVVQSQNPWNGKVFLQAFWWDYYNSNYPDGWYNYLAELAPRLRAIGLDAVWVPPSTKASGNSSVGYDPFDNYDLGDKFQKGLKTRAGDKNEYLRMVAVMHANGIDVYQDVGLNHNANAESADPSGWDDKYKNFRYVCYATPAGVEYTARQGRYPKNWENFHPNPAHNCNTGNICSAWWGPDICYWKGAVGTSSNATYNPAQTDMNYMRSNAIAWMIWLKKQTGVDGFRLDAVKHYEPDVTEGIIWNLQYNAGWASGGDLMFNVGEYLDNSLNMDAWCNAVNNRAGTFDFSLRGAIKNMTSSSGAYNLGDLVNSQQSNRARTAPFVNNHDTFRPLKDANGNYIGWDGANETGGHIEPGDPRIAAGYAFALSVDGNPSIFFEDLFNIGTTSKRYIHRPTNTTDLPKFDDVATLIHLYKQLNFKGGAYKVPFSSPDHLVIERSGKAITGISDNWDTWQASWITTGFAPGTVLIDYAGSSGSTDRRTVAADQRVQISTPPCNGTAKRRGYSVWAPEGIADFVPTSKNTVQEWELADDLGDSHPGSLQQGGALPAGSTNYRTAGKIFSEAGQPVTVYLHPADSTQNITLTLANLNGTNELKSISGKGNLVINYMPLNRGWISLKAKNTYTTNNSQTVWIKASYQAPQVLHTDSFPSQEVAPITNIVNNESMNIPEFHVYPNPSAGMLTMVLYNDKPGIVEIRNTLGQLVLQELVPASNSNATPLNCGHLNKGIYFIQVTVNELTSAKKIIIN